MPREKILKHNTQLNSSITLLLAIVAVSIRTVRQRQLCNHSIQGVSYVGVICKDISILWGFDHPKRYWHLNMSAFIIAMIP